VVCGLNTPRKNSRLNPATALHLVEILIEEGKLVAHEITCYLKIAELEKRLRALRCGEVPVPHVIGQRRGPKPAKRRKKPISAERRASQKIQGQYLGYISQIAESRPDGQPASRNNVLVHHN
jgi:hypothetical protein